MECPDVDERSGSITPAPVDALAPAVVAILPSVAARIPIGPAAELVRTYTDGHPARDAEALLAERRSRLGPSAVG